MTTESSKRVWSSLAIHPGESLVEELEAREMDIDDFAVSIGTPSKLVRRVLEGKAPVTAELALALETALNVDATFWMNLQTAYDLTVARQRAATSAVPR